MPDSPAPSSAGKPRFIQIFIVSNRDSTCYLANNAHELVKTARLFAGRTGLSLAAWRHENRGHRKPKKSSGGTWTVPYRDAYS